MNKEQGTITVLVKESVAYITFYHPAGNSFPGILLKDLADTITSLNKNREVTLIVLKSEGNKTFCAGASFDELLAVDNLEKGAVFFNGFANVINAMRTSDKIIIGRIQGKAVGGGVGLAAACDYVFATEEASVKLSELAIGIGPFVIEPAVSRKIGIPATSEMTLNASEWKTATWAKENKLYNEVFGSVVEMDEALDQWIQRLASYNPEALYEMKKVLWQDTDHWGTLLPERAKISGRLVLSEFTVNALNQFKNK